MVYNTGSLMRDLNTHRSVCSCRFSLDERNVNCNDSWYVPIVLLQLNVWDRECYTNSMPKVPDLHFPPVPQIKKVRHVIRTTNGTWGVPAAEDSLTAVSGPVVVKKAGNYATLPNVSSSD